MQNALWIATHATSTFVAIVCADVRKTLPAVYRTALLAVTTPVVLRVLPQPVVMGKCWAECGEKPNSCPADYGIPCVCGDSQCVASYGESPSACPSDCGSPCV